MLFWQCDQIRQNFTFSDNFKVLGIFFRICALLLHVLVKRLCWIPACCWLRRGSLMTKIKITEVMQHNFANFNSWRDLQYWYEVHWALVTQVKITSVMQHNFDSLKSRKCLQYLDEDDLALETQIKITMVMQHNFASLNSWSGLQYWYRVHWALDRQINELGP